MTCAACSSPSTCKAWGSPLCYRCLSACVRDGASGSKAAVDAWLAARQRQEAAVSP